MIIKPGGKAMKQSMSKTDTAGDEKTMLRASVIVPVHNSEATIGACLESLAEQGIPPREYEIIVVDDGSTDGTVAVVEGFGRERDVPRVSLLRQERSGPAAARNLGAREARGDVLLFTDSDCFPDPDWAAAMLEPFADPEVAGAKGTYRTTQRSLVARFVQQEYESKYRRMAGYRSIDFVDTYSAAFRRDVFLAEGGYDTRFREPSVEDQEFSFRLAARGYRMVFAPDAVVRHLHADSLPGYFRKKLRIGFFKALLLRMHPGRAGGDTHTPKSLQAQVVLVMFIPPLFLLSLVGWIPAWVPAGAFGLFLATVIPFAAGSLRADRAVVAIAPVMVLCRSIALAGGLLAGLARFGRPGRAPNSQG